MAYVVDTNHALQNLARDPQHFLGGACIRHVILRLEELSVDGDCAF